MLVIHVYSSIVACSSHYQPCCSYYALTSSALIKINALRYHFMCSPLPPNPSTFPPPCPPPKNRTQVYSTEPICCIVAAWEFIFSFHPYFLCFSPDDDDDNNNKKKPFH